MILIAVRVNGRGPFFLLLDTGSMFSTVDRRAARRMGLPLHKRPYRARGSGGSTVIYRTRYLDLEVGPLRVRRLPAVAVDFSRLRKYLGTPVHGSLGYSFLKGRILQIDYPRRRIRLYRRAPWVEPDPLQTHRVALDFPMKLCPEVSVPCIQGARLLGLPLDVAVDTGFNQGLFLAPSVLQKLGLDPHRIKGQRQGLVGYGGRTSVKAAMVKQFFLGPLNIRTKVVIFTGSSSISRIHRAGCPAVIGNDALADWVLTLDYMNRRVILAGPEIDMMEPG